MSLIAYDRIQDALRDHGRDVKESGPNTAQAQCPAHEDHKPSLSITKTEGRTLLHCHAGCLTEDVLAAVGLTMRDLYNEPFEHPKFGTVYAKYPYLDGRVVYRKPDKSFPQSGNTKGKDRALFHADRIGDAQLVFVVEGEEDVYAIEAVGGVAVSSAMGAGKAHWADWKPLRDRHVIIVADKGNKVGREHAAQVAKLLHDIAASVSIVEAAVGKDTSDHIAAGKTLAELVPMGSGDDAENAEDDEKTVPTVPWPELSDAALYGVAGDIIDLVAPHTEADPAAILVQLLAEFGVIVGSDPHIVVGNERHRAIIHPLIVGRTNSGAKGTGLAVVEAVRKHTLDWFDEFTASGLSSAEGLIELVRDPAGDPDSKDYDPGVSDKRLLIKETEYRSVLERCRREGNTLGMTLRQCWDGGTLRTLTRKHNRLTATDPHIVVIGHITPREFRGTVADGDLAGGNVNRLLICLSRRSRLHPKFGNIPEAVLNDAAKLFDEAYKKAVQRSEVQFTDDFWELWNVTYRDLNRDRPDSPATDATARGVTQVLRLSLIYALFDGADRIDAEHLDAALALWSYCEHSARWLFSSYEAEVQSENAGGLAAFIRDGGPEGRTRTEISVDYFKRNTRAAEITAQLTQMVHDGVVVEIKDETGARPITRYVERSQRINELTKYAGQDANENSCGTNLRTKSAVQPGDCSSEFADLRSAETPPELQLSLNSLVRTSQPETNTNVVPPGAPTAETPGMTERVQQIAAKHNGHQVVGTCDVCGTALKAPESHTRGRCRECHLAPLADEGAEQ